MTIKTDPPQEQYPIGVAHAHRAAEAVVARAVTSHEDTGDSIDGPGFIFSVVTELTAEDLHQVALYLFATSRYDDLPPQVGSRNARASAPRPGRL